MRGAFFVSALLTVPELPRPDSKVRSIPWTAAASLAVTSSGTVDNTVGAGVGTPEGAGDGDCVGTGEGTADGEIVNLGETATGECCDRGQD